MPFDEDLAGRLRHHLSSRKGVTEKRLFGCACFLLDGNVLVGVWKDCLVARLGPDSAEVARREAAVRPFDITGTPMAGWVAVTPEAHEGDRLGEWVGLAVEFVGTLPKK